MSQKRIQQIERRIDRIKTALLEIGPMRPGSLTRQYKDPQHHTGAYWQISYTRRILRVPNSSALGSLGLGNLHGQS